MKQHVKKIGHFLLEHSIPVIIGMAIGMVIGKYIFDIFPSTPGEFCFIFIFSYFVSMFVVFAGHKAYAVIHEHRVHEVKPGKSD